RPTCNNRRSSTGADVDGRATACERLSRRFASRTGVYSVGFGHRRPRSYARQDTERFDGLGPQWAEPFFATLAAKPNERRSLKVEITGLDVEQLLHAGAGIEQREQ